MRHTPPRQKSALTASPAAMQARLENAAARFRQHMAQQDYAAAASCCEEVLRIMPNQMQVLSDYALCLLRLGHYSKSYRVYQKIYQAPPAVRATASETWLDGLAELCGWMGKREELAKYGLEALNGADARFRQGQRYPFPAARPEPIDLTKPEQNVIAFSLYGGQPRYCETLIKNVEVAQQLYPGWRCRIYLDQSVPQHVWQRLNQPHVELIDMSQEKAIYPTLWRFLVMDDPGVKRFIIRDADSLLSEREAAAVDAWLASPYWFHHMRDYFSHTELLLAGMWGGCNGVFSNMAQAMRDFIARYSGNARFTDQYFLKAALWPTVRESLLSHDEIFHFHQAQPWPPHAPVRWRMENFHVGSNAGFASMAGKATVKEGETQSVELTWGGNVFVYPARVKGDEWLMPMPFFLTDAWKAGELQVKAL
ncbi:MULTISPECIES: lipopolysaccharide assembly protein LapB [unclassified Pantoea]|uniref:tetratricopeptide repeat protein n=1 Tax=unclassified Pantoea TaxID=2630326 RepID=UPI0005340417|nr:MULTISPECIES: tetratricopeptide repeat protein [unclassified Pantoea]MDU6387943.1 tetratricopeptide repeat protein [Pantoea sp.]